MLRRYFATLLLFSLVACVNPAPACRDLVAASPGDWPAHWQRVRDLGSGATPALVAALQSSPDGPGAQAGIHLLGVLGDEAARDYLEAIVVDGTDHATEAALALGKLGGEASVALLRGVVDARDAKVPTRAAAAAALVTLGHGPTIIDFLEAIFLAATPHTGETSRKHFLPRQKSRWALERYVILEALRARYPTHVWPLDEDGSWPALRDGAADLRDYLANQ